jgi:hypothetical protein
VTAAAGLKLVTLAERPDLLPAIRRLTDAVWPAHMEYIHHDAVCHEHWPALLRDFADCQLALCDRRGRVQAAGYTIPFVWDRRPRSLPSGIDGVLIRGITDRARARRPDTLSALLAAVDPDRQGRGLSRLVIEAMATVAARRGLRALVAPVRPTLKHRYPLVPMERYSLAPGRRGAVRSVAACSLADGRAHPSRGGAVHGRERAGERLGALDRAALSRQRRLRRSWRADHRQDRSPPRPRPLRRAQRLDVPPRSARRTLSAAATHSLRAPA